MKVSGSPRYPLRPGPHESAGAAITYVDMLEEAERGRLVSASPIALLLPVTGFLILLINCAEAKPACEVQRSRVCLNPNLARF